MEFPFAKVDRCNAPYM